MSGAGLDYTICSRTEGMAKRHTWTDADGNPLPTSDYGAAFALRDNPGADDPPKLAFDTQNGATANGSSITWLDHDNGVLRIVIDKRDVADTTKFPIARRPPYQREYWAAVRLFKLSDGSPVFDDQSRFRIALREEPAR